MGFKVQDHYFKKAKKENYLARSAFKLEEIQKKYRLLKAGEKVLDLGYHPGSWTQYCSKVVGPKGEVVGIDIQELNRKLSTLENVRVYQKDIFEVKDLAELEVSEAFDVVVSDMAPKTTGIKSVDQIRSLDLVETVFAQLPKFLRKGGNFTIKVFESSDAQKFLKDQKEIFKEFHYLRPKSTRSSSKEFFVIGKGYL